MKETYITVDMFERRLKKLVKDHEWIWKFISFIRGNDVLNDHPIATEDLSYDRVIESVTNPNINQIFFTRTATDINLYCYKGSFKKIKIYYKNNFYCLETIEP